MKIINNTRGTTVAVNVKTAVTPWARMVGLLDRECLLEGEGLVIAGCQQIHMFFMRFPIDVIFVNSGDCVVGIVNEIQPFRVSPIFWKSTQAIELPVGAILKSSTQLGDSLEFIPTH